MVALFALWFLLLRPGFLGGPSSYVWVSGDSMEPKLHQGDLVVLHTQGSYVPGDIVAFRVPEGEPGDGAVVIHRIVGGSSETGFIMQGDNKSTPDRWRPTDDDILGSMWFSIPGAGRFLAPLQAPAMLAGLAAAFAVFLILLGKDDEKGQRKVSPVARSKAGRIRASSGPRSWPLLSLMERRAISRSRH